MLIDSPTGDDNQEPDWFKQERGYGAHAFSGELYNLRDDLAARKNLYSERPDIVSGLDQLPVRGYQ